MNTAMEKIVLCFAALATLGLILIMVAIPLNVQEIFYERDSLASIEVAILLGFLAVLVFDLLVFAWVGKELYAGHRSSLNWMTLVLSLGCLLLLVGVKVLLDEIAREQPLGAAAGEWLVMYICFAGQMFLNLLVLFRFLPLPGKRGSASRAASVSD